MSETKNPKSDHCHLFTPGPVEVSLKTRMAMTKPLISHRSPEFSALYRSIQPLLQELFETKDPVFISTSSSWGVMEGAIRNLCRAKQNCVGNNKVNDSNNKINDSNNKVNEKFIDNKDSEKFIDNKNNEKFINNKSSEKFIDNKNNEKFINRCDDEKNKIKTKDEKDEKKFSSTITDLPFKVLNCMNGAFSDKWHDVAIKCGKNAKALKFEWGKPVDPESVRRELSSGEYDTITLVHNETSCGVMSDIKAIMDVVKLFPDVISIVDVVSSLGGVRISKDELGIDVMIAGCQKALALPPGITLFSVSNRAMERCKLIDSQSGDRGYYFDFLEFYSFHQNGFTPSTPNISLIYALQSKLEDIKEEGLENVYRRHKKLNTMVRDHILSRGFTLFPENVSGISHGSLTLNCFANTLGINLEKLNSILKEKHNMTIDTGYGKLKGKTFRISNMGDFDLTSDTDRGGENKISDGRENKISDDGEKKITNCDENKITNCDEGKKNDNSKDKSDSNKNKNKNYNITSANEKSIIALLAAFDDSLSEILKIRAADSVLERKNKL